MTKIVGAVPTAPKRCRPAIALSMRRLDEQIRRARCSAVALVADQSEEVIVGEPRLRLCGVAEAATVLGVARQRIYQLIAKGVMPDPVCRLAATPVWLESDVRDFAARRAAR